MRFLPEPPRFTAGAWGLKLPCDSEMRNFDQQTISAGTAASELMERAGQSVVNWLVEQPQLDQRGTEILLLCGPGNNGGDGFVVARELRQRSFSVTVLCSSSNSGTAEAQQMRERALLAGVPCLVVPTSGLMSDDFSAAILKANIVVEALLGIGQKTEPRGHIAALLAHYHELRQSQPPALAVSIDIPAGINGDTGECFEPFFKASHTLCIELIKRGLIQFPARQIAGNIATLGIGIDCRGDCDFEALGSSATGQLAPRPWDAHKGSFGSVLVIGGSQSMGGAPILSAHAALRCGAGVVRLATPNLDQASMALWPEIMRVPTKDEDYFTNKSFSSVKNAITVSNSVVLGPGMGTNAKTLQFCLQVLRECAEKEITVVLDADALRCVAKLKKFKLPPLICTPHPGELARILNKKASDIQSDRYRSVFEAQAHLSSAVWVLKGAGTIIFSRSHGWVCLDANPYLATAGSGDVLAGMIAAMASQGLTPTAAATSGVKLHARCAEYKVQLSRLPLIAHDIIESIPKVFSEVFHAQHSQPC